MRLVKPAVVFIAICLLSMVPARTADAQQSISDVLSFLVTNRSIPTADFDRDEQAAIATRDTIGKLLSLEIATLPSSSGGGFTYTMDPSLGTVTRSSDSFAAPPAAASARDKRRHRPACRGSAGRPAGRRASSGWPGRSWR